MSEGTDKAVEQAAPVSENEEGSIMEASEALLNMLDADNAQPGDEESQPTEDEVEAQPETEVDSDEEVEEEDSEDEYEPDENRDVEGEEEVDVYSVKVDGVDTEVTLEELTSGYSRQKDYTKKTQALAEDRKKLEEVAMAYKHEFEETQRVRQQYVNQIGQYVQQGLHGLQQYGQIDWKTLKEEDPLEYVTKRDEFREEQHRVQRMQQQQQHAASVAAQEGQRAHSAQLEAEQERLVELEPEWADEKKRPEIAGRIRSFAEGVGFSSDEIDSIIDHRAVQVLMKAAKYDSLQNSDIKTKKVKRNPKVIRAGSPKSKGVSSAKKRTEKMNRLKGSGSAKDAASLLEDLL